MIMLEDRIIKSVIEAWTLNQSHPLHERVRIPVPPFHQVKALIETAFLASLEREEDMPVRFALVLADPEIGKRLSSVKRPPEYLLHLQGVLPLSVASIAKLAPALDPGTSAMAVGPAGVDGELGIWGVFTFSPTSSTFNEIPPWVYGDLAYRPDLFTVYAANAGSIVISRHNSQIGRILNGEFTPATPSPFTMNSLGRYLVQCVQDHELYGAYGDAYWRLYRETVELLLSEAGQRGHGSIFALVMPEAKIEGCITPRFGFREKVGLAHLMGELLRDDLDVPTSIAMRKTFADRVRFLAQLGTVDGAVILDTEFGLAGFGVMLAAPPWQGTVITGPDGFGEGGGEVLNPARLGMRHNSALAFAGAVDGSIVFVISQDGPVRVFVKSGKDTLLYWPDCCGASMSP
jgi:hypothetical protein